METVGIMEVIWGLHRENWGYTGFNIGVNIGRMEKKMETTIL